MHNIEELISISNKAREEILSTGNRCGFIKCPICGKRLAFAIRSNGHVQAECETEKCLWWRE